MDIRPQDLPELRAQLAVQFRQPGAIQRMFPKGEQAGRPAFKDVAEEFVSGTAQAEMFHVSESMGSLAATAAKTIERFPLQQEDVPCQTGLIVFDGEAPHEAPHECGCVSELRGIAWYGSDTGVIVVPAILAHGHHYQANDIALDTGMTFLADFSDNVQEVKAAEEGPFFDVFGLLITTWLLMQQPLANTEQIETDRAARKRLRRLNAEPGPVRVITLRRPKTPGEAGQTDRQYHHRWITRGHWRQQWYPARQVHRPVWIAPHIKGPEDAPLIGGEKVYAWKR